MQPRIRLSLAALAVLPVLAAAPSGTALAQRAAYATARPGPRGPLAVGTRGSAVPPLRRESPSRTQLASTARSQQLATIDRAESVLRDPSASSSTLRAAGEQASNAYHEIGSALAGQGDHAGAANAFTRAATSRWGRNDVDMRFRSTAWTRVARAQTAIGDRRAAAESLRRAAESLDRLGTEGDQVQAASLYREEAALHAELGDTRAQSDALVGSSEALMRAGHIVTDSHQRFDRGAPSTWPESADVLRARAHDHYTAASQSRETAARGYRSAGLGFFAARRALNNPRTPLSDAPSH